MSVLHDVIVQIVTERADYRTATILQGAALDILHVQQFTVPKS